MNWISCEDRLPDRYQNVVFTFLGTNMLQDFSDDHRGYRIGYYDEGFRTDENNREITGVTHWESLDAPQ